MPINVYVRVVDDAVIASPFNSSIKANLMRMGFEFTEEHVEDTALWKLVESEVCIGSAKDVNLLELIGNLAFEEVTLDVLEDSIIFTVHDIWE